jgi:GxxExxY protein
MGYGESTSPEIEEIARTAVDAAFRVHSRLGPGVLESAYETCLAYELRKLGYHVETQVVLPILYDGVRLDAGYRIDL